MPHGSGGIGGGGFGFGGSSFDSGPGSFGGFGGLGDSIGAGNDSGDSFADRQRQRQRQTIDFGRPDRLGTVPGSRVAAPTGAGSISRGTGDPTGVGGRFTETGGGDDRGGGLRDPTRDEQLSDISARTNLEREFGDDPVQIARRNLRDTLGNFLGLSFDIAQDEPTGLWGIEGRLQPAQLAGSLMGLPGMAAALSAGMPLAALQQALNPVGQGLASLLGPGFRIGFEPSLNADVLDEIVAKAGKVGRDQLTPAERLAVDFFEQQQAREQRHAFDLAQRGDAGTGVTVSPRATRPAPPAARRSPEARTTSPAAAAAAFGRAQGTDSESELDLLRTRRAAAVAAGQLPPAPTVRGASGRSARGSFLGPARAGALI